MDSFSSLPNLTFVRDSERRWNRSCDLVLGLFHSHRMAHSRCDFSQRVEITGNRTYLVVYS